MPDVDIVNQYFDFFGLTWGVLIVIGAGVLIFLVVAIVLERRTKLIFPERDGAGDDFDFDFGFDDEDEQAQAPGGSSDAKEKGSSS